VISSSFWRTVISVIIRYQLKQEKEVNILVACTVILICFNSNVHVRLMLLASGFKIVYILQSGIIARGNILMLHSCLWHHMTDNSLLFATVDYLNIKYNLI
jgi:hypothetical protein